VFMFGFGMKVDLECKLDYTTSLLYKNLLNPLQQAAMGAVNFLLDKFSIFFNMFQPIHRVFHEKFICQTRRNITYQSVIDYCNNQLH
jgi:hypothetical protein